MAAPTPTEIRAVLEGYNITDSVLSDEWVISCRDEEIIPHIEDITRQTFDEVSTVTEYLSGTGTTTLMLSKKPVNSITSIQYVNSITEGNLNEVVELIQEKGIIKSKSSYSEQIIAPIFQRGDRNIKVTYTYGFADYPTQVARAIKNLVAAKMLNQIGARTGGGNLSVQAHSRSYGAAGKYTEIRKELVNTAYWLLRKYMTGVVAR